MIPTLILGYGNVDRQDDGAAWHILARVAGRLGRLVPASPDAELELGDDYPHLQFMLQLTPELAELLGNYERICFVDAHTGDLKDEVRITDAYASNAQLSPFSHHMLPAACLTLTQMLYGKQPAAILVSVLGHQFGFERTLSPETDRAVDRAVEQIWNWLQKDAGRG